MEVVGNCPLCGSPIYGIRIITATPPPMWRSCSCADQFLNKFLSAMSAVDWHLFIRYLLEFLQTYVEFDNPDDPQRN